MSRLDWLALLLVFGGLLFVGYTSARKIKETDDFLLAGRNLNKIQAAFSVAASDFGGSGLVGATALCYQIGLSGAWWNWCAAPAFLILGIFLVKRLRPLAAATAPEFLEMRYDKKTRTLATAMQISAIIPMLSAQFLVGAVALNTLFGVSMTWGLVISVALVLSYTAVGGLMSVANTDVFNFIILVGSVIIAVPLMIAKAGGVAVIMAQVPESFFSIGELGALKPISWIFMSLFMYGTQQAYLQRVFASKDVSTATFSYVFTSGAYLIYGFMVAMIGITMSVLMPGLEDPNTAYAMMIKTVMPMGLAGLGLGGIFAASLSSADSVLLAGTTLFVNDIYKTFINKDADDKKMLWVSRIATLIICVGGVVVANLMQNLIQIVYVAGLFYSAAVFFPIIIGVYWKRANATGAFFAIIASFFVGVLSEYVFPASVKSFLVLPSNMLAAFFGVVTLIVVSLVTPRPPMEKLLCMDAEKKGMVVNQ